jgi:hypothetical protein
MKKRLLLGIVLFVALNHLIDWGPFNMLVVFAQSTQVTGVVKDANGVPYAGAQMRAGLVFAGAPVSNPTVTISTLSQCRANGFGSAPCQVPFTPSNGPFNLDSGGNIPGGGITLQDNTQVTPAGTTWQFTVNTPGNPPPLGTGPQTCTATLTISGASQSVSGSFSACPALSNVTGGVGGGSPSGPAIYTFSNSGGTATANPQIASGLASFSGTDSSVVVNNAMNAAKAFCGTLYFEIGQYNLNSLTLATAGPTTTKPNFAIGFPGDTGVSNQQCEWHIKGAGGIWWAGEVTMPIQTTGVLFFVTPTAVASVGGSALIAAWWHQPGTSFGNQIYFENIAVRFPDNQRGNTIHFYMPASVAIEYRNTLTDFNIVYTSLAAPVQGTLGNIGYVTSNSALSNIQHFVNTYAVGSFWGYDLESEHVTGDNVTAIFCNRPAVFGAGFNGSGALINHPIHIGKFTDQENINGIQLGPNMAIGSRIDVTPLDMEIKVTGPFTRLSYMSETNPGNTGGDWTYSLIQAGVGPIESGIGVWSAGGFRIRMHEGTGLDFPSLSRPAYTDPFIRPNSANIGQNWVACGGFGILGITSNSATGSGNLAACNSALPLPGPDQFSAGTVNTVDGNGMGVTVRTSTAAATYYEYGCTNAARLLIRRLAGTQVTLLSNANACAVGDTIELDVIGSTLFAYITHAGTKILDFPPTTDTNITSGLPGILTAATTDSFSSWSGGGFPLSDATNSIYSKPIIGPTFVTLTNCQLGGAAGTTSPAACGSAAAGTIAIPASQTTYTVNTTAVTTNSQIDVKQITDNSGIATATCNAGATNPIQSARVVGTSFTFTLTSVASVTCVKWTILN